MKFYAKVVILMVVLLGITLMSFNNKGSITDRVNETGLSVNDSTPSIKMYNSIIKWSAEYDIPVQYAFALAYTESRYKGPAHVDYKSGLTSKSGALGPMQIKLGTAKLFLEDGEKVTKKILKNDIDFNVMMSMPANPTSNEICVSYLDDIVPNDNITTYNKNTYDLCV